MTLSQTLLAQQIGDAIDRNDRLAARIALILSMPNEIPPDILRRLEEIAGITYDQCAAQRKLIRNGRIERGKRIPA